METTELRANTGNCSTRECSGLRKGEWICAECAGKNFSARISCYRCSLGKWESEIRSKGKAAFDWECFRCKFSNFSFRHSCLRCKIPKHVSDDIRIQRHGIPWLCRFCNLENWGKNHKCFKCSRPKYFAICRTPSFNLHHHTRMVLEHGHRRECKVIRSARHNLNNRPSGPSKLAREKCHILKVEKNLKSEVRKVEELLPKYDLDSSSSSSEEDLIELEYVVSQEQPTVNENGPTIEKNDLRSKQSSKTSDRVFDSLSKLQYIIDSWEISAT